MEKYNEENICSSPAVLESGMVIVNISTNDDSGVIMVTGILPGKEGLHDIEIDPDSGQAMY